MRAIVQRAFGGPEQLRLEEVAEPLPRDGQVLVEVEAAGVHFVDTTIRDGEPFGPSGVAELPMIPGREVAGRAEGRPVVAHLGLANGGYAERALAPAEAVHDLPEGADPVDAVAMIGTGRTAMVLLERAELTGDDVVLVTAAAGGLGVLFLQAARNAGATAIGLAGPAKLPLVAAFGAAPVDYTAPAWRQLVQETPTVLFDGVGGPAGRTAAELLAPGGRVVSHGWASGEPTDYAGLELDVRRLARPTDLRPYEEAALAALTAGELRPLVTSFPLAAAGAAHAALERRTTVGKVVLRP
jgi:NADPH:quinone reductase